MKSAATPLPPGHRAAAAAGGRCEPRGRARRAGAGTARRRPVRRSRRRCPAAALWVLVYPRTPDLAGQVYRVDLFRRHRIRRVGRALVRRPPHSGLQPACSRRWARCSGCACSAPRRCLPRACCSSSLAGRAYGQAARWGAVFFAVAAVGDVWAGRVDVRARGQRRSRRSPRARPQDARRSPAVLSLRMRGAPARWRRFSSALAALALSLHGAPMRALLILALPAGVLVLALALLFPEGGYEPYPITSFAATRGGHAAVPAGRSRPASACCASAACSTCWRARLPAGPHAGRQQHRAPRRAARRPAPAVRARRPSARDGARAARGAR